ncbi:hypothetical protein ABPG72_006390 [Tetrahymena utriculariae]
MIDMNNDQVYQQLCDLIASIIDIPITSFDLSIFCHQIGDVGASEIAQSISKLKNLTSFSCDFQYMNLTEISIVQLADGIGKCQNLRSFHLNIPGQIGNQAHNITNPSVSKLEQAIQQSQNLIYFYLDIDGQNIDEQTTLGLARSICQYQSLVQFYLSSTSDPNLVSDDAWFSVKKLCILNKKLVKFFINL